VISTLSSVTYREDELMTVSHDSLIFRDRTIYSGLWNIDR